MRRILALSLVMLLVALELAGCTVAPKQKKEAPRTGSVRVLVLGGSGLETTLTNAFTSANPGVTVETVRFPDGDFQAVMSKLKSGDPKVDVIVAPGNSFLFSQGVVTPLDDLIKAEKLDVEPYGHSLELARFGGKVYGLPVMISPMLVTYNRQLFEQAGLKQPEPGWTWSDFDNAVKRLAELQAKSGKEKAWAFAVPDWTIVDLLLTSGRGPADSDLGPLRSTLERLRQMQSIDRAMPKDRPGDKDVEYYQAFARGEVAMVLNYWEYSFAHASPTFAWGMVPIPVFSGEAQTPGVATLAMVSATAENKENAFAFASFVSGNTGAQAVVRMPGAPFPGYVNATIQKDWLAHAKLKDDSAFLMKLRYLPTAVYPDALVPLLLKEADAVLAGQKSPDAAIADYQKAREPILSKK